MYAGGRDFRNRIAKRSSGHRPGTSTSTCAGAPIGLVVEIDGSQHRQGLAVGDDNLRQNAVTIGNDLILRFDLFVLRLRPDEVVDQVWQAHAVLRRRRLDAA